jgi:hypothetical protein
LTFRYEIAKIRDLSRLSARILSIPKELKFRSEGFEGALAGNFISDFSAGLLRVCRGQKSEIKFSDEVPSEAAVEILAM